MSTIYKKYRREWSTLVALLITFVLFSALEPSYLSATNVATIITQAVTYGLMGIGMTCVIISGGIDLSVGSSLALLACIGAQLAKMGLPIPVWIVVCLVLGFLMGAVNGVLVGKMKLQPFIATMGTMQVFRGVAYVITGGYPVLNVPRNYRNVFNFKITSVMTFAVVIFFLFAIVITFVLKKTKIGAYTYAVGGNEDAARLSGVRVERTKALIYGIGMLGTTLAALVMIGRLGTGDPSTGQGYEMDAIAAAVLGGTSMQGGKGNVAGTVVACLILNILKNGLVLLSVSSHYQEVLTGVILVIAVLISESNRRKRSEV